MPRNVEIKARIRSLEPLLPSVARLADREDPDAGVLEASDLLARLGIDERQLIAEAYVDLIARGA